MKIYDFSADVSVYSGSVHELTPDPPRPTASHEGLDARSALSSSQHEVTNLNLIRVGSLTGTAEGDGWYSKRDRLVRRIFKVSASLELSDALGGAEWDPDQGVYFSSSLNPGTLLGETTLLVPLEVGAHGRIRDVRVWVEFAHHENDRYLLNIGDNEGGSVNDVFFGLGGVTISLIPPGTDTSFYESIGPFSVPNENYILWFGSENHTHHSPVHRLLDVLLVRETSVVGASVVNEASGMDALPAFTMAGESATFVSTFRWGLTETRQFLIFPPIKKASGIIGACLEARYNDGTDGEIVLRLGPATLTTAFNITSFTATPNQYASLYSVFNSGSYGLLYYRPPDSVDMHIHEAKIDYDRLSVSSSFSVAVSASERANGEEILPERADFALDPYGEVHGVFTCRNSGSLFYVRRDGTTEEWTVPTVVNERVNGSVKDAHVSGAQHSFAYAPVAIDVSHDTIHAAYFTSSSFGLIQRHLTSSIWIDEPEPVDLGAFFLHPVSGSDIDVVTTSDHDVMVAVCGRKKNVSGVTSFSLGSLFVSSSRGGWHEEVFFSSSVDGQTMDQLSMTIDYRDDIFIGARVFDTYGVSPPRQRVYRRTRSGKWDAFAHQRTFQAEDEIHRDPGIAIDHNGNVQFGYSNTRGVGFLSYALTGTNEEIPATFTRDFNMRTIFHDSSRNLNPLHLLNSGDRHDRDDDISSPSKTAFRAFRSATTASRDDGRFGVSSGYYTERRGAYVPWMLDERVNSSFFDNRGYSSFTGSDGVVVPTSSLSPPVGWNTDPYTEFTTRGVQLGPEDIKPVFPLLDDVLIVDGYDGSSRTRRGLRGRRARGTWYLLLAGRPTSVIDEGGPFEETFEHGLWFRNFRLEFLLDENEPDTFTRSRADSGPFLTTQVLKSFHDIDFDVTVKTRGARGPRGISTSDGDVAVAVSVALTGALASADLLPTLFANEFGTLHVPDSFLTASSGPTFTDEDVAESRERLAFAIGSPSVEVLSTERELERAGALTSRRRTIEEE